MENVVFVSPRYPPYVGGVEVHVSHMAKHATKFFQHVSVITTDPSGRLKPVEKSADGVTIHRVKSVAPGENYHFPSLLPFYKLVKESNAQVLHVHSIHDVPGPIAGSIMPRKSSLMFTPHYVGRVNSNLGRLLFSTYRTIIRRFVARVPRIICISRFESKLMVDNFPEAAGKVEIIPNGIDSGLLQTNQWREPSEPSILYAGRLEKYKNVDMVMKAVAKLRHKYERLTFKIVGSGPFKDELKQLSHSLGVEKNVEWIPRLPQKELFPLYASSSIVVQASEAENWGNTVAEAIGVGAPTIVANASSLAEFAEAGLAHSVQTPIDEGRLASKIGEVLESPRKYSPLGIKSPLIISWEEVAEKTFSRYTDFHTAG